MTDPTSFINACSRGNATEVEKLLQGGVNPNLGDYDKRTPMHLAASEGKGEIIRLLLSFGADVNVVDRWGNTPLDDAIKFHQDGVADLLMSVGAVRSGGKSDDDGEGEGSVSIVNAYLNLAAERLGAKVLWANEEWFAPAENLIKPGRGIAKPHTFTDRGQWMDGWETARHGSLKRGGKDTAYIKLGATGVIRGFDVDTNNFTGNHGEFASVDALYSKDDLTVEQLQNSTEWKEVLPKTKLNPGSQHIVPIKSVEKFNYVRLHMYPDGGIARLKVYGDVTPDWSTLKPTDKIDLISAKNGGKVVSVSDNYFSSQDNVLMPDRGINMGDGWETRRSRRRNNSEWIVIKLGRCGVVKDIEVDTHHFKGNYPNEITILGCYNEGGEWKTLLPRVKLQGHLQHYYEKEVQDIGPITHIRAIIYPDGGVSRLRLNGHIVSDIKEIKVGDQVARTMIKAPPLIQSNFHFFGTVIDYSEELGGVRDKRIPLGTSLTTTREGSNAHVSVIRFNSVKVPFALKRLEKQLYGSILFSPLSHNSRYIVVCALSSKIGNHPDLFNLSVSVVGAGQAVHINYGIWYFVAPIDNDHADFLVTSFDSSASDVKVASIAKYGIHVDV